MSLLYLGISGIGEKKLFFWPPIVWNTPIVWNKFLFDGPYSKLWWSTVNEKCILHSEVYIEVSLTVFFLLIPWVLFIKKYFGLGIIEGKGLLDTQVGKHSLEGKKVQQILLLDYVFGM